MAVRLQRGTTPASCVTSTGMPAQNAATILKPLVPITHSTNLHTMQHVADWVAPFARSHNCIISLLFFLIRRDKKKQQTQVCCLWWNKANKYLL